MSLTVVTRIVWKNRVDIEVEKKESGERNEKMVKRRIECFSSVPGPKRKKVAFNRQKKKKCCAHWLATEAQKSRGREGGKLNNLVASTLIALLRLLLTHCPPPLPLPLP